MFSNAGSKPEKSYLSAAVESISPWTSRSSTPKPVPPDTSEVGLKNQQGPEHSVTFRRGLSLRRYPRDCPPLEPRWFYAADTPKRKPKLLKETLKESKPLPPPKKFATFSVHDSRSIEAAYQALVEENENLEDARIEKDRQTGLEITDNKENTSINEAGNLDQGGKVKVPVNEDFLFDVDVERRELAPVYWLGPIYEVRRGTWFYQDGSVCEENLATQLEEGYLKVKPFRYPKVGGKINTESVIIRPEEGIKYQGILCSNDLGSGDVTPDQPIDDLKKATRQTSEKPTTIARDVLASIPAEPQTHRLFGSYLNSIVTYQDETVAWLTSDGIISRVSSTVYQRFAGGGYLGGVKLVRGYTAAKTTKLADVNSERPNTPNAINTPKLDNVKLQLSEKQQRVLKRKSAPPETTSIADNPHNDANGSSDLPETQDAAMKRQITSMVVESMSSETDEEAARRYEEKDIQNDYVEYEDEDQSREIEHLILVTHGIGQRLGMRTESVNFVHDVNVLRQTLKSVYLASADLQALNSEIDKLPKNCRIQVLPVFWRHELEFPRRNGKQARSELDIGDMPFNDDEIYPSLDDITPKGVPFVRSLVADLALDILLYQSAYREHICRIVLRECNRIYKLFLDRNPYFEGKVSLIGHSLGSAVLFDILCRQKEGDVKIHGSSQHSKYYHARSGRKNAKQDGKDLSFDFAVEDFYCLGSPIGLFQMLKGRTIAARQHPGAIPAESPLDPDSMDDPFLAAADPTSRHSAGEKISSITGLPFSFSSPKCAELYNIFYPSDPISYRLEPLIAPAMSSLKPQVLPYTKKGLFGTSATQGLTGIGTRVGQSVSGFWSSLSSGIASSLLNRSLGLTSEEVASMTGSQAQLSPGAGTNVIGGGVISEKPSLLRSDTNEKQRQLAEDTAAADWNGDRSYVPALIDDEIETLYSGFQKRRKSHQRDESEWTEAEEKGKRLRREELKVRGLNKNGRVDYIIQESVLDFNPINTIASHLNYWSDEDVSHFIMSQLLSRSRNHKRARSQAFTG